jgi:hypothetical protein
VTVLVYVALFFINGYMAESISYKNIEYTFTFTVFSFTEVGVLDESMSKSTVYI